MLGRGFSDPPVSSSLERACQIETKMADLRRARPSLLLHQAIVATVGMGVSTIILFFLHCFKHQNYPAGNHELKAGAQKASGSSQMFILINGKYDSELGPI